ncbi:MAG: hypothetical protein ACO3RL_08820 [Vulcanococcus sp.]
MSALALKNFLAKRVIPPVLLLPEHRAATELVVIEEATGQLIAIAGICSDRPFRPWLPGGMGARAVAVPEVIWVDYCSPDASMTCELLQEMGCLLTRSGLIANHEIVSLCSSCITVDAVYAALLDSMACNRSNVSWLTSAACLLSADAQRLMLEEELEELGAPRSGLMLAA